jgi:dTDP-4-amino-4,6-dideoxygalactose transaminase
MKNIPMVDLQIQYLNLKEEIGLALHNCLHSSQFIGGDIVKQFENDLSQYLKIAHVIGCANGTDALQIALMALNLPKDSKIIVPAFTYIAPVEVIKLLGFTPVYADVDAASFNITVSEIEKVFTPDVKAIIAVHLFGQPCGIDEIAAFAKQHNVFLVEDNAQSLGAEKNIDRDSIITTSFFPSKNLGAYGDGGAIMTNDTGMQGKLRKIANHGQRDRYYHDEIGVNSRLDALQASILGVKLKHLDEFNKNRRKAAAFYNPHLSEIREISLPEITDDHIFHQYTIRTGPKHRNTLHEFLRTKEIATSIYYPLPCYHQKAYFETDVSLPVTEKLCSEVLSLPIYPEISEEQLSYICESIKEFFRKADTK